MESKTVIILLVIALLAQLAVSQTLTCSYADVADFGYTCRLQIDNPNGFDGFTTVGGLHLTGRTNDDVVRIESNQTNTAIFPQILGGTFINIATIQLDNAGLQRIGVNAFASSRNLRILNLNNNNISEFAENALVNNVNLERLDLSSNALPELSVNTFTSQSNLRALFLTNNQLVRLPEAIFNPLVNLDELILNTNRLYYLPANIFRNLVNLRFLRFQHNELTVVNPKWFENPSNITGLWLCNNLIEDLPPNFFSSLQNLELICFEDNRLTEIHADSFGRLPNLLSFSFGNNRVQAIDVQVIDNTGLRRIGPGTNPCAVIPEQIDDETETRTVVRTALQTCFLNYRGRCEAGNLIPRVCQLEREVEDLRNLVTRLNNENSILESRLRSLELLIHRA